MTLLAEGTRLNDTLVVDSLLGGDVRLVSRLTIVRQIAAGLGLAHRHEPPILHRNLTPGNVLTDHDGSGLRVRIVDLGLSGSDAPGRAAAPEVRRGERASCAADVWAVGVVAYALLTGRCPFGDPSPDRQGRVPLPPSRVREGIDRALDAVVLDALAADPDLRIPDAVALGERLRSRVVACTSELPRGDRAECLARRALGLSTDPRALGEATQVLNEAVSLSDRVRERYGHRLALWRRGVTL